MLSGKRNKKKAYLQFIGEEDSLALRGILEKKKWPSMLGSEKFISWVKEKFFEKKKNPQVPESFGLAPDRDQVRKEVCRCYEVDEGSLLKSQRGKNNEPRDIAIYLCRVLRNDTLRELGQSFNMTGYSPASSAVERVKKRLPDNKSMQIRLEQIKKGLLTNKGQSET